MAETQENLYSAGKQGADVCMWLTGNIGNGCSVNYKISRTDLLILPYLNGENHNPIVWKIGEIYILSSLMVYRSEFLGA